MLLASIDASVVHWVRLGRGAEDDGWVVCLRQVHVEHFVGVLRKATVQGVDGADLACRDAVLEHAHIEHFGLIALGHLGVRRVLARQLVLQSERERCPVDVGPRCSAYVRPELVLALSAGVPVAVRVLGCDELLDLTRAEETRLCPAGKPGLFEGLLVVSSQVGLGDFVDGCCLSVLCGPFRGFRTVS